MNGPLLIMLIIISRINVIPITNLPVKNFTTITSKFTQHFFYKISQVHPSFYVFADFQNLTIIFSKMFHL